MRTIFSFIALFTEPLVLPLSGLMYLYSFGKRKEKWRKRAWLLLILTIVQAIFIVFFSLWKMIGR